MTDFLKASSIGRKIERVRKIKGFKQDALARMIGVSPQTISRLEQSDNIDEEKLEQIAKALGVTVDDIKNFDEEAIFNNFIENNETINQGCDVVYNSESVEKIVELYEALLKSEREKIEMLQKQLQGKKN
ncbi:helix-turn-helix domain-containing protein [Pedobacter panaciterrae]|uniref:helix-turn-helix domain-containing protein n=1 Tax=Pedobacter panaciterrae TaxID=363849 RepID=UPI002599B835|nr:helix-turn-helix domain-containing protein [uncultured Pedobacter sp.]